MNDVILEDVNFNNRKAVNGEEIPVDTYISENNESKDLIVQEAAERFVDKVKNGKSPAQAARDIGATIQGINNSDEMKKAIASLVQVGELDAELRKRMLKAGLNKMFMETVNSPNVKERKLALEAAKLIGQDPEVGANDGDGAKVVFDLGDLASVLAKPITLPGIEKEK